MDFLSDAIVDQNPTTRSPFNECIVLATICGRTLSHNQQYNIRCLHGDGEADWSDWDTWFDNILSARLQILSKCYPSPTTGYDPMLLFAHVIAQASVIYLCKEVKSMVWPNGKARSLRTEYQQRALNAAEHIVKLAYALVEFSVFKVIASASIIHARRPLMEPKYRFILSCRFQYSFVWSFCLPIDSYPGPLRCCGNCWMPSAS